MQDRPLATSRCVEPRQPSRNRARPGRSVRTARRQRRCASGAGMPATSRRGRRGIGMAEVSDARMVQSRCCHRHRRNPACACTKVPLFQTDNYSVPISPLRKLRTPNWSACAAGYNHPRCANETEPSAATTTWSRTRTPTRSSASRRRVVMARSAALGSGEPLGWLCANTTADAF